MTFRLLILAAFILCAPSAYAGTITWTCAGGDNAYATGEGWCAADAQIVETAVDGNAADIATNASDITALEALGTIASNTSALGTSSISANSCATVVTTTATGTATTDVIIWTPNADIEGVNGYGVGASGDGLVIYAYPTSNNVNFKVCNATGSAITPGAVTLNWRVMR